MSARASWGVSHSQQKDDRAPSIEPSVPRAPHETGSGQVLPRHTGGAPYRCSLPGLAGFDASRCVGPNLQRHPVRFIRHEAVLERGFNTAIADCGLQGTATSPSSTATSREAGSSMNEPDPDLIWRRGWDSNPRHSYPCTAFPVPHLRPLGHPSCNISMPHDRGDIGNLAEG